MMISQFRINLRYCWYFEILDAHPTDIISAADGVMSDMSLATVTLYDLGIHQASSRGPHTGPICFSN